MGSWKMAEKDRNTKAPGLPVDGGAVGNAMGLTKQHDGAAETQTAPFRRSS